MDFNEFKRKYAPAVESEHVDRDSEPPQETQALRQEHPLSSAETEGASTGEPTPLKPAAPRRTFSSDTSQRDTEEEIGGFFSGERGAEERRHTHSRRRQPISADRLGAIPWVDIIMILLTIVGIIWVIVNFDAITLIIAAAIGKLLQSLIGLLLIAALIAGVVLIVSRRRRRFF